MGTCEASLLPRRVYGTRHDQQTGELTLELSDSEVVLDAAGHALWNGVVDALGTGAPTAQRLGLNPMQAAEVLSRFWQAGLLVDTRSLPAAIEGTAFHGEHFQPVLPAWLNKAFAHPFWNRMMSGQGSARMYAGWLIELYHYTRNANRHMPLAVAHCRSKPIKALLAKHYEEEYNHYHFFSRAARAMGMSAEAVANSAPLPMTSEMSDFMRQAARTDVLCYAICSAVLEGTTTDGSAYDSFYSKMCELYDVPRGAVQPIYDHLALDAKYQHADLFNEICALEGTISRPRAALALEFGHQMVEHIWMWTDSIERYYGDPSAAVPRPQFDTFLD